MASVNARDRLILAVDVPSADSAEQLLTRLGTAVSFVKIGLELYTAAGPDFVRRVIGRGKRVFLDLKFLDIEETVRRATAVVAGMGVEFLTVHANRKALTAAVEGRGQHQDRSDLKLLAVTVLTNFDEADLRDLGMKWKVPISWQREQIWRPRWAATAWWRLAKSRRPSARNSERGS